MQRVYTPLRVVFLTLFSVFGDVVKYDRSSVTSCRSTKDFLKRIMHYTMRDIIVYRRDWLWSPADIKGANNDVKIYVGRSTTLHNLLFCAHTLCMNYVTNIFLLVGSSVRSKQLLCFVQVKGKKQNNNIQQKHLTSFITIPLDLLTMAT